MVLKQYVVEDATGHDEVIVDGFLASVFPSKRSIYAQYATAASARSFEYRPAYYLKLIKLTGFRWFFRKGNPNPVPRFDVLANPEDKRKAILDSTLDHTLGVQEAAADSMNIKDILPNPTNWGVMILIAMCFLLLGYVLNTVV